MFLLNSNKLLLGLGCMHNFLTSGCSKSFTRNIKTAHSVSHLQICHSWTSWKLAFHLRAEIWSPWNFWQNLTFCFEGVGLVSKRYFRISSVPCREKSPNDKCPNDPEMVLLECFYFSLMPPAEFEPTSVELNLREGTLIHDALPTMREKMINFKYLNWKHPGNQTYRA